MLEEVKLDNGLRIYLVNDNNKHTTYINLIINFGGLNNKVIVDNKKYNIKNGTAHFLEHLVLESSEYGDLMKLFGVNGVGSNGFTSIDRTQFYIDCVDNIYNNLGILLTGLHSPIINDDVLNKVRGPILEEKKRSLDNKCSSLYNSTLNSIIDTKGFKSVLGDLEDISSINSKDIEIAFKSFYRPDNEVLIIGGRFDKEKILDVIKEAYNDIKFDNRIVRKDNIIHRNAVKKTKIVVKEDTNLERSVISFKLNTLDLKPYDKLMLDTYLYYVLKNNFGITSNLNTKLVNENIIIGNMDYSCNLIEGYHVIRVEADTKNMSLFNDIIVDYFKNKKFVFDLEYFDLFKKNYIIDLITRSDDIYKTIDPLIENIVFFKYNGIDSIDDILNIDFLKYKNIVMDLDFNNYVVAMLRKK